MHAMHDACRFCGLFSSDTSFPRVLPHGLCHTTGVPPSLATVRTQVQRSFSRNMDTHASGTGSRRYRRHKRRHRRTAGSTHHVDSVPAFKHVRTASDDLLAVRGVLEECVACGAVFTHPPPCGVRCRRHDQVVRAYHTYNKTYEHNVLEDELLSEPLATASKLAREVRDGGVRTWAVNAWRARLGI